MTVVDNLRRVRERIARAAESVGRSSDDITLIAVTKYVDAAAAAEVVAAGCHNLGESRPQDLWSKVATLGGPAPAGGAWGASALSASHIDWHLIGHLQRNKVRRTLPLVSLIHSVDSERLLEAISNEAASQALPPVRVLLEVNTSGEAAKHGLAPAAVEPILAASARFPHVAICGLMTMAALEGGSEIARKNFATLRELRDRLQPLAPDAVMLDELSMGMSGDFEEAILEGATMVRVGSAIWESMFDI